VKAERRPVEVLVRDEAGMVLPAPALELDAEDGGMLRARELLEPAEPRQPHVRLTVQRAVERVGGCERVVHG